MSGVDPERDDPGLAPSTGRSVAVIPRIRGLLARVSIGALVSALLSFVGATIVMRLWRADFSIPFAYEGDARAIGMLSRRILQTPNYLTNPFLGWPAQQELAEVPQGADNLTFVFFWIIGRFTDDFGMVMNVYFVATFVLIALTTYAAMRLMKFSPLASTVVATLYAFLPYHFARGEAHLLLAGYYLVPLALVVTLWQLSARDCLLRTEITDRDERRLRIVVTGVTCVLLGMTSAYYAVFFALLLIPTVAVVAVAQRSWRLMLSGLACAGITAASLLINVSPTLVFWAQNGRGTGFVRAFGESEVYGLKFSGLFLPVPGHRLEPLRTISAKGFQTPIATEIGQPLGILASLGLVLVLIVGLTAVVRRFPSQGPDRTRLEQLSLIALFAIMLGSIGGLSTLISLAGFDFLRVYARLSVIFGLIGLIGLATAMDALTRRRGFRGRPAAMVALAGALIVVGVFDQTTDADVPNYAYQEALYKSDAAFVSQAEGLLPSGARIFQLPILPYPESPAPGSMNDYDHLRGFLHSENLYYSYGAIKGRDDWQLQLTLVPPRQLARVARAVGYDAIWVDRFGYTDRGVALETELAQLLGPPIVVSPDQRLSLFNVRTPRAESLPPLDRALARSPLVATPAGTLGFEQRIGDSVAKEVFGPTAAVYVDNLSSRVRPADVRFEVSAAPKTGGVLTVTAGGVVRRVPLTTGRTSCRIKMAIEPGRTSIDMAFKGAIADAPPLITAPRYVVPPYFSLGEVAAWDSEDLRPRSEAAITCFDPTSAIDASESG